MSFNNDANDTSARNDPKTVRTVSTTLTGHRLAGDYTVVAGDFTGGEGLFFVQCGSTVRQVAFTVTGR